MAVFQLLLAVYSICLYIETKLRRVEARSSSSSLFLSTLHLQLSYSSRAKNKQPLMSPTLIPLPPPPRSSTDSDARLSLLVRNLLLVQLQPAQLIPAPARRSWARQGQGNVQWPKQLWHLAPMQTRPLGLKRASHLFTRELPGTLSLTHHVSLKTSLDL